MAESNQNDFLARLAGCGGKAEGDDPWAAVAATSPAHQESDHGSDAPENDSKLKGLIDKIQRLTTQPSGESCAEHGVVPATAGPDDDSTAATVATVAAEASTSTEFVPIEPGSFSEARLTDSEVEAISLKYLLARGDATGRAVADQLKLPFLLVEALLRQMKADQLVGHRSSAAMNDYVYQLTDVGRERARRLAEHCTYYGAAPVALQDYIASVQAQSLDHQRPSVEDLRRAFADLLIGPEMLARLGPAINSGRGLFLYGEPGNGKTSIAERVTKAFGQTIWVPRAIGVDGEIIRLYDPSHHEEIPPAKGEGLLDHSKIDKRWVRIRRPTICTGGELTMANLEVTLNTSTGVSEAPVQLKSNCGTLVIDDFGRQQMSVDTLLNRWIVPLEKRYDFLNLANGKKIQVPFDQLIIFATNLEPRQLCDEAFLRRIAYKIEVVDPTEEQFHELFRRMCHTLGFEYRREPIDYLIRKHYREKGRPMRCCHPRDLLMQVRNHCLYHHREMILLPEYFDFAVDTYFSTI